MHLPLTINQVHHLKDPPWSSLQILSERDTSKQPSDTNPVEYDLLLLDTKQFAVQTICEKNQRILHQYDALNGIRDEIVHIFPSKDKHQSSIGINSVVNIFASVLWQE